MTTQSYFSGGLSDHERVEGCKGGGEVRDNLGQQKQSGDATAGEICSHHKLNVLLYFKTIFIPYF